MKNKFLYIAAASMAVLAAGACQKESRTEEVPVTATEEVIANPVVIRAALDADETKATVSSAGNFAWTASTDRVAYHTTDGYVVSSGASETGASTEFTVDGNKTRDAFAIFPSTIVAADATNYGQESTTLDVTLPGTYTLDQVMGTNTPCPMIAPSNADAWSFSQLCGLIRMTVNSIPPSATKLTVDFHGNKVQGAFSIASPVTPGTSSIVTSATDGDDDIITITFDADGTSWRDGIDINLPIPTGDYTKVTVEAYNDSDPRPLLSVTRKVKIGEDSYTLARAAGKKLTASLPAFSISDTKRVAIAKSNLQYTRPNTSTDWAEGTWSFMENPWTEIENSPSASLSDPGVSWDYSTQTAISLLGWGATGYDWTSAGLAYGSDYQPWSTGTTDSDYGPVWGNSTGINDLTGDFAMGDFGVAAQSDLADGYNWRMLTAVEAAYLLGNPAVGNYTQSELTKNRYMQHGFGTVCGHRGGAIFLPDYFVDPKTNNGSSSMNRVDQVNKNSYSTSEWEDMEEGGAIYLPITAFRVGTIVKDFLGFWYWSVSTARSESNCYDIYADYDHQLFRVRSRIRSYGKPVRLIREIN